MHITCQLLLQGTVIQGKPSKVVLLRNMVSVQLCSMCLTPGTGVPDLAVFRLVHQLCYFTCMQQSYERPVLPSRWAQGRWTTLWKRRWDWSARASTAL